MKWLLSVFILIQPVFAVEFSELVPPAGKAKVRIYQIVFPQRFQELAAKMQAAAQKHPEIFHPSRMKPGEPIPYDSRMGLTQAEYKEFIHFSSAREQSKLEKVAEADMKVIKIKNESVSLSGSEALPSLNEIKLNLKTGELETSHGNLTQRKSYESTKADNPVLGDLQGYEWKLQKGSLESGNVLSMSILLGKRPKANERILYYKIQSMNDGVPQKTIRQILMY